MNRGRTRRLCCALTNWSPHNNNNNNITVLGPDGFAAGKNGFWKYVGKVVNDALERFQLVQDMFAKCFTLLSHRV